MDWRLLIVGAGVLLLIAGLLAESDFSSDVFDSIDSKGSGLLDKISQRLELATVNGSVEYETFQVETKLLSEISLDISEGGAIKVGKTLIKNSSSIRIYNYTGKVTFGDNITLDGKAAEITAGDVVFEAPEVEAEGVPLDAAEIPEITEGDFLVVVEEGEISLGDSTNVSIKDEELEITGFKGSLSLDDDKKAELSGTFNRVYVKGTHMLKFTS